MKTLMKRSWALMAVLSIVALSACGGGGGTQSSTLASSDAPASGAATVELTADNVNSWLDEYMPKELESRKIAGATVAVVKDSKVLTIRGYGYADAGNAGEGKAVPVDPDKHLFRLGSISKIPTSIAVMQLVEQGKVDLDTDINVYVDVPIKRTFDTPITLRHLLTHTAGFEDTALPVNRPDTFDLESAVVGNPPEQIFEPGTTPAYSNYGMSLAGYIVQEVSGQRFEDYTRERIFAPLGMDSTTYEQPLPEDLRPRMSQGYSDSTQKAGPFEVSDQPSGSLTSTASDFAKFMLAQMNHDPRILKAETWEQMQTAAPNEKLGGMQKGDRIGLGYFLTQRNGHPVIGHDGDLYYFHSMYDIYPEQGVGVFISFNSMGNPPKPAYGDFADRFADQFIPEKSAEVAVNAEERIQHANQIVGTYLGTRRIVTSNFLAQFAPQQRITVAASKDGNISLFVGGQPTEFTEVEPYVWRETGGDTRISADLSTGRPRLNVNASMTLEPQTPKLALMGIGAPAGQIILAAVLVLWLLGGARNLICSRAGEAPIVPLNWQGRIARVGAAIAVAMPFIWLALTGQILSAVFRYEDYSGWIRGVQGLQLLAVLALIPAVWDVVRAVRDKRGWPRVLVAVALVAGLLAMACWAILGNTLNPDISY
ncbi:MAG: serine hydrolase domain-containing protein [Actinomycetaceae bacterium]|nr:serine hydrolase domain-containing protein [Actinomycetaceae bacterium]